MLKTRLNRIVSTAVLFVTAVSNAELLTIDFANDQGTMVYRSSGFLGGMSPSSPVDSLVLPLKPKLFRDGNGYAQSVNSRVRAMGAKAQLCLSLGSPFFNIAGANNNWTAWENHVRSTVSNAKANNQIFEYDIWNEPNISPYWTGTAAQFYEAWRRAFVIIRSIDPAAVIIGPSANFFDLTYIKNFLQYAKANNVLPTALCWHELGGRATVRGIQANVEYMRTYMAAQGINIQKIYINEMTSSLDMYNPGLIVRHLAAIEKAKVDGAAKSCWNEKDGTNNCYFLLDGIVTHGSPQYPRSAWWAYKSYADISGRLVGVIPGPIPNSVDGVAGQDAAKREARAVLGRYAGSGSLDVKLVNVGSVPFLTGTGTIHVTAKRIPNTADARLAAPTTAVDANYGISNNSMQFTIPAFADSDAYAIQFTPGGTLGIGETQNRARRSTWNIGQNASAIRIEFDAEEIVGADLISLSICDTRGRRVKIFGGKPRNGIFSATWSLSGQMPGVYFLRLKTGQITRSKVVVVP